MENDKKHTTHGKNSKSKVLLFLFSTLFFCLLSACSCATETKPSFDEGFPGSFTEDFSKANYWQDNVVYLMHVYKEALFLYDGSTVSIFKDNELSVFEDLSNYNTDDKFISGLCFFNNFFYFSQIDSDAMIHFVFTLNLDTHEISEKGQRNVFRCVPFGDSFYSPLSDKAYMNIDSNGITFKTCENGYIERYDIDNSYIAKEYHSGDIRYGKLYMIDENGNKTRLSEIHDLERYYLIQLADGRIVIYNCGTIGRQSDVLVWIINTDGTVEELFGNVTGEFVYSTINISGDSLIVSLLRYEKWEKMQHVLFKEDELSGTWSINLNTSEAKLITKTFYKGLYVFGNQIYCVDQNDRFSVLQP